MGRSRVVFFSILVSLTIIYIGGCRRAGEWLVKNDSPVHGDAMVLLMGSISDRVLQAADLYEQGVSDRLIIVEESMGAYRRLEERGASIISNTSQAKNAAVALGIPEPKITVLPGDARSTLSEAGAVRDWLADKQGLDTIILVTSSPHTRRASMIFRAALVDRKPPVFIMCSPSIYTGFDARGWWRNREGIQTVLSETVKITSFWAFERHILK